MSKRLKRTWAGVLLAAVVLAAGTTGVFAAGQGGGKNYTDANQDGICDNYASDQKECLSQNNCRGNYVDADHDGVCDHDARQRAEQGKGFRGGRGR